MLTSLGAALMREFGSEALREGCHYDVTEELGELLLRRNFAFLVPEAAPADVRAVPPADLELESMSKADLIALAEAKGVPDVKPAMFKGDVLAAIRRHLGR